MVHGAELQFGSRQVVTEIFDRFREELDEHDDRRERIIKVSANFG
jgi:hypothetical protein